jgi:hypothetical protein
MKRKIGRMEKSYVFMMRQEKNFSVYIYFYTHCVCKKEFENVSLSFSPILSACFSRFPFWHSEQAAKKEEKKKKMENARDVHHG